MPNWTSGFIHDTLLSDSIRQMGIDFVLPYSAAVSNFQKRM
jgi:hypothetical protein